MFVQMRDVVALVRTHSLRADVVAHRLCLAVDLVKGSVRVLLPVNFIAVDLKEQNQVCEAMRCVTLMHVRYLIMSTPKWAKSVWRKSVQVFQGCCGGVRFNLKCASTLVKPPDTELLWVSELTQSMEIRVLLEKGNKRQ